MQNNTGQTMVQANDLTDVIVPQNEEPVQYLGKRNCFSWSSQPVNAVNSRYGRNIVKIRISKPLGPALALGEKPSPEQIWRLFFTDDMVDEIVIRTNCKLDSVREELGNKEDPSYKKTNKDEISALFGLLILSSIFKSSRESLTSLFSTGITGRPIFRAIMSEKRCHVLIRALRFDDASTRQTRREDDPAAAISNLFNCFVSNCKKNYEIGACACIDETLIPFRGRCPFKMYMPKKPSKYGIKMMCLTDAHNSYLHNAYLYVGKDSDGATLTAAEKKLKKPTQAVVRLSKELVGTNRNITCDNWFMSLEVADFLWQKNLTIVGTLKGNKPQIPKEFLPSKDRPVGSSIYGYTKECTLLSYVPKKSKSVILLSTMHHVDYTDAMTGKPEIITFYNATKSGVDTLDMKCSNYSANRRTRRWPLAIFYHLLAVSCSNGYVLYEHFEKADKMSRFDFMKVLGLSMTKNHLRQRLNVPNHPDSLKKLMMEVLNENDTTQRTPNRRTRTPAEGPARREIGSDKLEKRKNCRYCPYQKNRMTSYKCIKCETPTCLECSKKLCNVCVADL